LVLGRGLRVDRFKTIAPVDENGFVGNKHFWYRQDPSILPLTHFPSACSQIAELATPSRIITTRSTLDHCGIFQTTTVVKAALTAGAVNRSLAQLSGLQTRRRAGFLYAKSRNIAGSNVQSV
jgi:hypothetical protein